MRAVIFDIDGTLLDSAAEDDEIYRLAVEQVVGPVRFRSALHDYEHVTDTGILLQTLADNDIAPTDQILGDVKTAFFHGLSEHVASSGPFREVPGAADILDWLRRSANHGVAIATGGWRGSAMIKLEAAGIPVGDVPLASSDDAIERAAIMRFALDSLGRNFANVTYFGDGPWDRAACDQLGWTFQPVGPALNGLLSFDASTLELLD